MKLTPLVFLLPLSAMAGLEFKGENFELRLFEKPCTHAKVVSLLKDEWKPRFKQGSAVFQGRPLQMCWIEVRPGFIAIIDEDGDAAEIPLAVFEDKAI